MKFLVGLDESPSSEFAFMRALEMAEAQRKMGHTARMYIVGVPESLSDMFALYANPHLLSNINHRMSEKTEAMIHRFEDRCTAVDVECVTHIDHGIAREVIMQAIDMYKPDLVVLGRTGSGGLERKLKDVLGSTSAHVMQNAPCSVLIVKNKAEQDDNK